MTASVVISTKNRKDELRVALRSASRQSIPLEIIVLDDGSTDGTAEMVRNEFPCVIVRRFEESRGYIVRRNEGARIATGDIIVSIDDDAEFSSPRVVEQTLGDFDDPRIAAIAIPYVEPRNGNRRFQMAPDSVGTWVTDTFVGTAHALRREAFVRLGGYRELLVHQGEEGDFAVRLLDKSLLIRLGRSDSINHWESARRDFGRMDYYGPRNAILFQWQNAPPVALIWALVATTGNCLLWSLKPSRLVVRVRGLCAGYRECVRAAREPVRQKSYRLWRRLRKRGPMPIQSVWDQIAPRFSGNS